MDMEIIENMCGSHKVIPQENLKSKSGKRMTHVKHLVLLLPDPVGDL